jgi:hypothetical protein
MGMSQIDKQLLADFTLLPDAAKAYMLDAHPELLKHEIIDQLLGIASGREGEAIADLRPFGWVSHDCYRLSSILPQDGPRRLGTLPGCYCGASSNIRNACAALYLAMRIGDDERCKKARKVLRINGLLFRGELEGEIMNGPALGLLSHNEMGYRLALHIVVQGNVGKGYQTVALFEISESGDQATCVRQPGLAPWMGAPYGYWPEVQHRFVAELPVRFPEPPFRAASWRGRLISPTRGPFWYPSGFHDHRHNYNPLVIIAEHPTSCILALVLIGDDTTTHMESVLRLLTQLQPSLSEFVETSRLFTYNIISSIAFSPDGNHLKAATDGEIAACRLVQIEGQLSIGSVQRWQTGNDPQLAFAGPGALLVCAGNERFRSTEDTITWYEVGSWRKLREIVARPILRELRGRIAVSADGRFMAGYQGEKHELVLRDLTSGREIRRWSSVLGAPSRRDEFAFDPIQARLAWGQEDGSIWLLNYEGEGRRTLLSQSEAIHGIAFSPDGRLLASASAGQTLAVWVV